ncbi:hypothetical protein A2872_03170 [Candidatus Gottesmanbacteria bacterium RIFCSPHIGHO2_01_FULL_42_12]|uniref:Uncharacterized protein n=1 Tax=Candidatus Gottesmanbacteria bacterium RIFCSPHIGHO2_01_FULL_42_12 TaxID=1798377 RepID=A0A1F5Z141_9BACT|nr:MAG: hypothetical protein A2872_03170 [Candidatus Gottesmanbacteria bacterium RIFCSPHIGHO2_01_FULL_42_12]
MYEQANVICHGTLDDEEVEQQITIFPYREIAAEEVDCKAQIKKNGQLFCSLCVNPEVPGNNLRCRPNVRRALA